MPIYWITWASQVVLVVKNPSANAGDIRDVGWTLRSGRCLGKGLGKSLQDSCPENLTDRGAWQASVHRVTKSWTRVKQLNTGNSGC